MEVVEALRLLAYFDYYGVLSEKLFMAELKAFSHQLSFHLKVSFTLVAELPN